MWWQRPLWAIVGGSGASGAVVEASGSRISAYRPDLLLEVDEDTNKRVVVGEVKLTGSDNATPAEARGVLECLAYIRDAADYYASVPQLPHGFVVAWGASGTPATVLVSIANEGQLTELVQVSCHKGETLSALGPVPACRREADGLRPTLSADGLRERVVYTVDTCGVIVPSTGHGEVTVSLR